MVFEDIPNWFTLIVEACFAVGLAVYFYSLQKKNDKKIQDIITKNDERSNKRKQFWTNVVCSHLLAIENCHHELSESYEQLLNEGFSKDSQERAQQVAKQVCSQVENVHIPRLDNGIAQIADLLNEPSLYNDITDDNYFKFKYLLKPLYISDTEYEHRNGLSQAIKNKINDERTLIEEQIKIIRGLIESIKKEMPAKAL